MRRQQKNKGSVFLIVVFVVALLAVLVAGMLQISTEEIQLMRNYIYGAQAMAIAEAGLNDAFAEIRNDPNWNTGFAGKAFAGGTYTVDVNNVYKPDIVINCESVSGQSYTARLNAEVTVGDQIPYVVRIDNLKVNE